MTYKLYNEDSYIAENKTTITALIPINGTFGIIPESSCFFPGGGGQSADTGFINNEPILEVTVQDEHLVHICNKAIEPGTEVTISIDFEKRFRAMQAHSGEHIFAGILFRKYGVNNIGFHMGEDYNTIDTDAPLEHFEIEMAEATVNDMIYKNLEIHTFFLNDRKGENITIRKNPRTKEMIRVVDIPECDTTACCGMHVRKTGDIGLFKVIDFKKYKKGTRIFFLCGKAAFEDYKVKNTLISKLSGYFSAPVSGIEAKVLSLQEELSEQKKQNYAISKILFEYRAEKLAKTKEYIEGLSLIYDLVYDGVPQQNKLFAQLLVSGYADIAFIMFPSENRLSYIAAASKKYKRDLITVCSKLNLLFNGKGGGSRLWFQGSVNIQNTEKLVSAFKKLLIQS